MTIILSDNLKKKKRAVVQIKLTSAFRKDAFSEFAIYCIVVQVFHKLIFLFPGVKFYKFIPKKPEDSKTDTNTVSDPVVNAVLLS